MLIPASILKEKIAAKELELQNMKEALKKLEHKKTPAEEYARKVIDEIGPDHAFIASDEIEKAFTSGEVHNCLRYEKLFDKLHILHARADHDSVSSMTKAVFDEFEILISGDK